MPEYTKAETKDVILNASPSVFPSVYDVDYGDYWVNNLPPSVNVTYCSFDSGDNDKFELYSYTGENWAIARSVAVVQGGDVYNGTFGFMPATGVIQVPFNSNSAPGAFTMGFFGFDFPINGSEQIDVAVTFDVRETFTSFSENWNFRNFYPVARFSGNSAGMIGVQEYDADIGNAYAFAAIFDPDTLTIELVNAWVGPPLFAKYNYVNTGGLFAYTTFVTNSNEVEFGIKQIRWNPQPFVNWYDGTYDSFIENVTFDDPVFNNAILGDYFWLSNFTGNSDRFFVSVYNEDYTITLGVLECFPATQTYNVLNITGDNPDLLSWVDNIAYDVTNDAYFVFTENGDGTPLYGFGAVVVNEQLSIPRYTPVRLPCIVNCIPVIDKRK